MIRLGKPPRSGSFTTGALDLITGNRSDGVTSAGGPGCTVRGAATGSSRTPAVVSDERACRHTSRGRRDRQLGLVPEALGAGRGRGALTLLTRQAWSFAEPGLRRQRRHEQLGRVFLHTSSWDHPAALANYRARGFDPYHHGVRLRHRRTTSPGTQAATQPPHGLTGHGVGLVRSVEDLGGLTP